jgi:hypothetical protein
VVNGSSSISRSIVERRSRIPSSHVRHVRTSSHEDVDRAALVARLAAYWHPGAIMTQHVFTNGRTFERPPEDWSISNGQSRGLWFHGSPQRLTAAYISEGVAAASRYVYEPNLAMTPRPDLRLPAYCRERNLAESHPAIPRLSRQKIVVGNPLCSPGRP